MEKTTDKKSTITLFNRPNSQLQNTIFFVIVTTIIWFTWMRHSLLCGVTAVLGCLERGLSFMSPLALLKRTTHHLTVLHPLFGLYKQSASIGECQWVHFFPHGGIRFHPFASYELPCQIRSVRLPLCCHLSHSNKYWWEVSTSTAIPPTCTCGVKGQRSKTGGIIFKQPS